MKSFRRLVICGFLFLLLWMLLLMFAACGNTSTPSESNSSNALNSEHSTETDVASEAPTDDVLNFEHSTETNIVQEVPADLESSAFFAFHNPISALDADTWGAGTENVYGTGDPFVLRWNGRYYLYCSTWDGHDGIKCWSSVDLVNWQYEGLCCTDQLSNSAYAPEVVYYNGAFYLYSSPAGKGHYVFAAKAPTGPFLPVTENFGMSIDGSVFIDDDGKWYFYHSDSSGIISHNMSSPTQVASASTLVGCSMNSWTEGPMVLRHDGFYYITYAGNHVLSNGYRIDYGFSRTSPIAFTAGNNPLLVRVSPAVSGIGHSSTVKGPNLDTYYLVYHSLLGRLPNRDTRIDPIVWNGSEMTVLGPSTSAQQMPQMPDVYTDFTASSLPDGMMEDGYIVRTEASFGQMTSELCFSAIPENSVAGAVFAWQDMNNYATALLNPSAQTLIVTFYTDGVSATQTVPLRGSFGEDIRFDCVQSLQIEYDGSAYSFAINDRMLRKIDSSATGAVGFIALGDATLTYFGVTSAVGGNSIREIYKTVPGTIPAITATDDSATVLTGKADISVMKIAAGDVCSYRLIAGESGRYDIALYYAATADTPFEVLSGDTVLLSSVLSATGSTFRTAIFRGINLSRGAQTLTFRAEDTFRLREFSLVLGSKPLPFYRDYSAVSANSFSDGKWTINDGRIASDGACARQLYGEEIWGDYTVEVDITPLEKDINCGILIRAMNTASGGAGDDANLGTDFTQGYYVGLTQSGVILGRMNYNWTQLDAASAKISAGNTYHLLVEVSGTRLTISLDGVTLLVYDDPTPFLTGMAGIRTCYCAAEFDNFAIAPLEQ